MTTAAYRYQEMDVLAMAPAQRVVLLYTHLLSNLRQAQALATPAGLERRAGKLERAGAIVAELLGSLDQEAGGEVAERLAAIYAWWLQEIPRLTRPGQEPRMERLIELVASLHETWVEAAEATVAQSA